MKKIEDCKRLSVGLIFVIFPIFLYACSDENFNTSIIEQGFTCLGEFQFKESRLSFNSRQDEEDFMNRQENKEKIKEIIQTIKPMTFVVYGKVDEEKKFLQEAYLNLTNRENISQDQLIEIPEDIEIDHLSSNTPSDIRMTNNLFFKYKIRPNTFQVEINISENDCEAMYFFFDDQKETQIVFDQKFKMVKIDLPLEHNNFYRQVVEKTPYTSEKKIELLNPYVEDEDELFLYVVCPFWKYKIDNFYRAKASLIYRDDLPLFQGIVYILEYFI